MNNESQKKNKNKERSQTVDLIIFTVISLVSLALLLKSGRNSQDTIMFFGKLPIKQNSVNGIYQGIITMMSVFMVCDTPRRGRVISNIIISLLIAFDVTICFLAHITEPIPGALNALICIIYVNVVAIALLRLEKRGMEDVVTKLYNQRGFMSKLKKACRGKKEFHLLYIHFFDYRTVIEQMDYEYLEQMYIEIAERIKAIVGENHVIGRIEGNDYAVILPYGESVEENANNIIETMENDIHLEVEGVSKSIYLPAYVGVSKYPNDGEKEDDLIHSARLAVYQAYSRKSKSYVRYDVSMAEEVQNKALIEKKVREALDSDSFYLVYQPQYYLEQKKLRGFETLIRCKFQDGSEMWPAEFIPVAEKSELITAIDGFVIVKAIRDFKDTINDTKVTLSVNVSAKTMADRDFVTFVKDVLIRENFPADCLEIEITEYSFVESMEQTIANILGLKELGVMIALDDFGTGYTSLAQLLNLPIDLLKIDKSLIDDIEGNKLNQDFVDSVIYMGHLMECEVISEGVETAGQLDVLRDHECDFIQGYVWGKPMEEQAAKALTLA